MIEVREPRIAPASPVFTGLDGDKIVFTASKGALAVRGDFVSTNFHVTGNPGSASVGGSVMGGIQPGTGPSSGEIG